VGGLVHVFGNDNSRSDWRYWPYKLATCRLRATRPNTLFNAMRGSVRNRTNQFTDNQYPSRPNWMERSCRRIEETAYNFLKRG
jgi:hypothetical protein